MNFELIGEKILTNKGITFAVFNDKLELTYFFPNFKQIINFKGKLIGDSLIELFPEFFGLEEKIKLLFKGLEKDLTLEKVNREHSNGKLVYFDFSFIPLTGENQIVLIVSDSTDLSSLQQQIQQQTNTINILKEKFENINKEYLQNIWGKSDSILKLKDFIKRIADKNKTTVLLTGESGTGKTLIAKVIHNLSSYPHTPFIEVNCATIPENLVESELFGHLKGSFTSAIDNKVGLIEEANGGTLFLDEIGELPISTQAKFLSFMETKAFRRIGSTKEIKADVRIITATNKNLEEEIEKKSFRGDLYYRINIISFEIPPLRDRDQDILIIAQKYLERFALENNKTIDGFSENAKRKLLNYDWPGNIRELRNIIERAVIFSDSNQIFEEDLLFKESDMPNNKIRTDVVLPEEGISLEEIEKMYLISALKMSGGNQTKAAKLLNLSLDTLRYRIKKFKI